MKNLFFLLIGVLILAACSNNTEDSISFNETLLDTNKKANENIDPLLKDLYITMIQSQSFINFEQEVKKFDEKLGNEIPESEMVSPDAILNWISANISKTKFNDYSDASSQYEKVLSLGAVSNNENIKFFEYLAGTQPGTLTPILDDMVAEPFGCAACKNAFKNCMGFANSEYTKSIQQASFDYLYGGGDQNAYNNATGAAINLVTHRRNRCADAFEKCCSGGY